MAKGDADAELMLRVKNGDESAFATLFDRHAPRLVAYADRFFRNRAIAEEVTQEVFLRVWRARRRYRPRARFTTWLYTIASRACLNELRRRGGRPDQRAAEPLSDDAAAEPGGQAEAHELARRIDTVLDELPAAQRAAFWLVRLNGFSYQQVAATLGMSLPAVKSALFRATEAVRRVVVEENGRTSHES